MVAFIVAVFLFLMLFPGDVVIERWDTRTLVWLSGPRTHVLTRVMLVMNGFAAAYTVRGLRWGSIAVLVAFRRWRHLLVYLGSIVVVTLLTYELSIFLGDRARSASRSSPDGKATRCPR